MAYISESSKSSRVLLLLGAVLITLSLYLAREVLIPVALAALLSFLLAPSVTRLQRLGLNRGISVWCVVTLAFTLLGMCGWLIARQASSLATEFPKYKANVEAKIKSMHAPVAGALNRASDTVKELSDELSLAKRPIPKVEVAQPAPDALELIYNTASPLVRPIGTAILVVVLVILMLLKREDLRDRLIRLVGTNQLDVTTQVLDDAAGRISSYLVMQSIISAVQGIAVAVGLTLIGLPNALLWGFLAAILKFIPYLGPWVAAALPVAQSMAVFGDWRHMLLTILLFALIELVTSNAIEPWLYGASTGVTPMALIVAAVFWTWLWGWVGLMLSTPLTVCLVVMGKYLPQLEFLNVLLGDEPVLEPQTRLYQRLLATDVEEATEIVVTAYREKPFVEVCDSLLIPSLTLIEKDRQRGMLDDAKQQFIFQAFQELLEEVCNREEDLVDKIIEPGPVLCLPSHDEADRITAKLFSHLLELNGVRAQAASVKAVDEGVAIVKQLKPVLVCFCALPPFAITHTCHLSRHLRNQFPSIDILVGLWSSQGDLLKAKERLLNAGAQGVLKTFAEALQEVQRLIQPVPLERIEPALSSPGECR
jgi:predicted PurR-regulated permease PerM